MSKKQQKYTAEFKAKVILDLLSEDLTLGQICTKYNVANKSVSMWKQAFLNNAAMVFNADHTAAEYEQPLSLKDKEIDDLHRQLGKRTAEAEWASKKLKRLDFDTRQQWLKSELENTVEIAVATQCLLLGVHRSGYYYVPSDDPKDKVMRLQSIDRIYSEMPFYGYRKVHKALLEAGYDVGVNRVNTYMHELGLKAICPTKAVKTTIANLEHKKYPYLLRHLEIN